jgi:hypothetical protein
MSIMLQMRSPVIAAILARTMQTRLHALCIAPIAGIFIDHADVADRPVDMAEVDGTIHIRVPIDVFIASRANVLAARNATPQGAASPAGTIFIVFEMSAESAVLSLRCIDVDLTALAALLGGAAPLARTALMDGVGSRFRLVLFAQLHELGMPAPGEAGVSLRDGIIAIRFGPAGNSVTELAGAFDWGIFFDSGAVAQLAMTRLLDTVSTQLSMTATAHWQPSGSNAHVDIDYAAKIPVPDPLSGDANGVLACGISLLPASTTSTATTASLLLTVHWTCHISGNALGAIDSVAESYAADAFDPAQFGGTALGNDTFTIERRLPSIDFSGARFSYSAISASPAGMTLAGQVKLPLDPGKAVVQLSVTHFGLPTRLTFCSVLARTGDGNPDKTAKLGELNTIGKVWLEDAGAFCGDEIVSPGDWIGPFLQPPSPGSPELRIVIPSAIALYVTQPVLLIVRTARGVRLIDLGVPPKAVIDTAGNVTNALLLHIPNCLYQRAGHILGWGIGNTELTPPMENPDWLAYLGRQHGVEVQLVTLTALEPGELIRYRSADHAVDVSADRHGRAIVPVMRPVANTRDDASLLRLNRRDIAGHYSVQTATFIQQARVQAGLRNTLKPGERGRAVLTSEFATYTEVHELGSLGVLLRARQTRRPESAHGDQAGRAEFEGEPLPQETGLLPTSAQAAGVPGKAVSPAANALLRAKPEPGRPYFPAQKIDLPGMTSLLALPGFSDAPIALARMADGTTLVLDLEMEGGVRVAGSFAGPIGPLEISAGWAIASTPALVEIYRVIRS